MRPVTILRATPQQRADTLTVRRHHGTTAAATWSGYTTTRINDWAKAAGHAIRGRGHPTREELERAKPRWSCSCPMCRDWQAEQRALREAELARAAITRAALQRFLTPPTEPVEQLHGDGWEQHATCKGLDPDLFFPNRGESTREAKAVCAWCPVREACLDYAITNCEKVGIWGGMSERERRRRRAG